MSVQDDHFLTEGWGCVNLIIFITLRVFTFRFDNDTEKALFQVILGLLLLSVSVCKLRERRRMSKSVYVLCCAIEQQL